MPPRRAVELRVGGQTYRVVGSEDDPHVHDLAALVDRKHAEVVPQGGRGITAQQAIFLTALALADEVNEQRTRLAQLEAERARSVHLATRAREVVTRLLQRVDHALCAAPEPQVEAAAARVAESTTATDSPGATGTRRPPATGTRRPPATGTQRPTPAGAQRPPLPFLKRAVVTPTDPLEPIPTERPALTPAKRPAARDAMGPAQRPAMGPAQRPAMGPAQRPAMGPAQRPAMGPAQRPAMGPAQRPAMGPAQRPAMGPAQRPAMGPGPDATDGIAEPADDEHEPLLFEVLPTLPVASEDGESVPRSPRESVQALPRAGLRLVRQSSSPDDESR